MIQHDLFDPPARVSSRAGLPKTAAGRHRPPAANPRVPPLGDDSRIRGLEAQVDDLKYMLNNVLQCIVLNEDIRPEDRRAALIEDARAALRAGVADYLG